MAPKAHGSPDGRHGAVLKRAGQRRAEEGSLTHPGPLSPWLWVFALGLRWTRNAEVQKIRRHASGHCFRGHRAFQKAAGAHSMRSMAVVPSPLNDGREDTARLILSFFDQRRLGSLRTAHGSVGPIHRRSKRAEGEPERCSRGSSGPSGRRAGAPSSEHRFAR